VPISTGSNHIFIICIFINRDGVLGLLHIDIVHSFIGLSNFPKRCNHLSNHDSHQIVNDGLIYSTGHLFHSTHAIR